MSKPKRKYHPKDLPMRHRRQVAYRQHHAIAPKPAKPVRKFLQATNEFWSETSEWEKRDGHWRCISGTGVLKQLVGMNPSDAKVALLKLGANWNWS